MKRTQWYIRLVSTYCFLLWWSSCSLKVKGRAIASSGTVERMKPLRSASSAVKVCIDSCLLCTLIANEKSNCWRFGSYRKLLCSISYSKSFAFASFTIYNCKKTLAKRKKKNLCSWLFLSELKLQEY